MQEVQEMLEVESEVVEVPEVTKAVQAKPKTKRTAGGKLASQGVSQGRQAGQGSILNYFTQGKARDRELTQVVELPDTSLAREELLAIPEDEEDEVVVIEPEGPVNAEVQAEEAEEVEEEVGGERLDPGEEELIGELWDWDSGISSPPRSPSSPLHLAKVLQDPVARAAIRAATRAQVEAAVARATARYLWHKEELVESKVELVGPMGGLELVVAPLVTGSMDMFDNDSMFDAELPVEEEKEKEKEEKAKVEEAVEEEADFGLGSPDMLEGEAWS